MIYIGEVLSIEDSTDGCRIKARILPTDKYKENEDIVEAFPLLPKTLFIKPKVGESVFIVLKDDTKPNGQRFYIGPIISQPQYIKRDDYTLRSTSLLNGSIIGPSKAPSIDPNTKGAMPTDEEIAILGRGDTDIILGENDLRIRCGAKKFSDFEEKFEFNRNNPSYIKLSEHKNQLIDETHSTATVVADNINLISNKGRENFGLYSEDKQITDEAMNDIIERAHVLPYGDILVDFLTMFLQMFKSHTHKYPNMPPCEDDYSKLFNLKYGTGAQNLTDEEYSYERSNGDINQRFEDVSKTFGGLGNKLLSKHVRID